MKVWMRNIGIGGILVVSVALITGLLDARFSIDNSDSFHAALFNLYYLPILITALLFGETGGAVIALLAMVGSSIAAYGFHWPTGEADWWSVGVRGAFFLMLAYLTGRVASRQRASAREWHSLLEVSRAINGSLNLDETLQQITQKSVELSSADACAIRLIDKDGEEMRYAKLWGLSDRYANKGPLKVRDSELVQRAEQGEDIIVWDVRKSRNHPYYAEMKEEGIVSVLSLPLRAGDEVIGLLNLYRKRFVGFSSRDRQVGRAFAEQAAIAIQNARLYDSIRKNYLETVRSLTRTIEAKDPMTLGHSERVTSLSLNIARRLDLSCAELQTLEFGAMLHDIGKVSVDEQTLSKGDFLSQDEQMLVEMHPMIGKSIIEPVEFLQPCIPIVFSHHERWDGMGYPVGLAGTDIPLLARIVALANAYDHALNQYGSTPAQALLAMRREAGVSFDPDLVDMLVEVVDSGQADMAGASCDDRANAVIPSPAPQG